MEARADGRNWGIEEWDLSLGGGKSLAWLSCVWKRRRVLCYSITAQMRPSTSNGPVCLPKRLLLRSVPDAGINWHGSNRCVIFPADFEMFLITGLCFRVLSWSY